MLILSDFFVIGLAFGCVLQSGDNVADRRLEESDDICDEFVLSLDSCELIELVLTDVGATLYVCTLHDGLGKATLLELLDELSRSRRNGSVHDSGVAHEGGGQRLQLFVVTCGDDVIEKGVLDYCEFDALVETLTTEFAGLRGIEARDVCNVEIRVVVQLSRDGFNNLIFEFFLHNTEILLGTVEECLEINLDTGAHSSADGCALHISSLESLGLELSDRTQHLSGVLVDLLRGE